MRWSLEHYKNGTKALCGAGYDRPSSIALTTDWAEVTCSRCRAKQPPK